MSGFYTELVADDKKAALLDGRLFSIFFDRTLGIGETKQFLVSAPTSKFIVSYGRFLSVVTGSLDFTIYSNPTVTSNGTEISSEIKNRNGRSVNPPAIQMFEDPSITAEGGPITFDVANADFRTSSGSEASQRFPSIFPDSPLFLFEFTNTSGLAGVRVLYEGYWEESNA